MKSLKGWLLWLIGVLGGAIAFLIFYWRRSSTGRVKDITVKEVKIEGWKKPEGQKNENETISHNDIREELDKLK